MIATPSRSEVILRRSNGTQSVWLKQEYLLKALSTLTEDYLRIRCRPNYKKNKQCWKFEKINGAFFYEYASIPNKAPTFYKSQLPTVYELTDAANDTTQDAPSVSMADVFNDYINNHFTTYLNLYTDCTFQQAAQLSKSAALIQGCIDYIVSNKVDVRKKHFWLQAAEYFRQQDYKYIPHNFRVLKAKVLSVMQGDSIKDAIKLPRQGNENRLTHTDEEIKSWVLQLRGMGENYTNAYIIRKIQYACEISGKQTPSERWIGTIMQQHNTKYLTALNRYGDNGRFAVMYKGYVPLQNALYAGDCWQIDGTRVNIISHKSTNAEVVSRQEFLYIVCVRDVHSGDILGWSFGLAEDRWMYINALKMAVKESGYLPYQLVRDRFPGHNTPEYINFETDLTIRGVKITETSSATGKAQLERFFSTWQTVFMQDSAYYYGEGIRSTRPYAHRSEAYLKDIISKAKKDGWNFEDACNETEIMIDAYRSTQLCKYSRKHKMVEKSPIELHTDSEKPHVIKISSHQFTYLFGLRKELQLKRGGLLITEIQKYQFIYRCTDHKIVSKYDKVMIVYQMEDLSKVYLYEVSDKPVKLFLGEAAEADQPQIYGANTSFDTLAKQIAIVKEMKEQQQQEYQYKVASGSDIVSLLKPTSTKKHQYNMVEDSFLLNSYGNGMESNNLQTVSKRTGTGGDDLLSQL
jgi:hypothetical protein